MTGVNRRGEFTYGPAREVKAGKIITSLILAPGTIHRVYLQRQDVLNLLTCPDLCWARPGDVVYLLHVFFQPGSPYARKDR